jgi:hypothetical protein
MRDLLECAWPAALDTARQPFKSVTWMAGLSVITGRDGGDLARTRRGTVPGGSEGFLGGRHRSTTTSAALTMHGRSSYIRKPN